MFPYLQAERAVDDGAAAHIWVFGLELDNLGACRRFEKVWYRLYHSWQVMQADPLLPFGAFLNWSHRPQRLMDADSDGCF